MQANWFAGADLEMTDPFGGATTMIGPGMTEESSDRDLNLRLSVLDEREARLASESVVCPIKANPLASCSACPHCQIGEDSPLSKLCSLGQEQERICTLLLARENNL